MTTPLDTTIKAFTKTLEEGLSKSVAAQGIKNIDGWLPTLENAEFRGAKTIHDNLGKLKKHLESDELDGPAIGKLLRTLADETERAATQADDKEGEKVKHLAELLHKASTHKGE